MSTPDELRDAISTAVKEEIEARRDLWKALSDVARAFVAFINKQQG